MNCGTAAAATAISIYLTIHPLHTYTIHLEKRKWN